MDGRVELPCCADWANAHESGTDNEGYGALIYYLDKGKPAIGSGGLPFVRFCPWCGAKKQIEARQEEGQ